MAELPAVRSTCKVARSLPTLMLSVVIAFFPKCPICWGVYMSMFGGLGLAQLPYFPWLLPVLMSLMGLHLLFLLGRSRAHGYAPFLLSVTGALGIALGRVLQGPEKPVLLVGMLLILAGSLWSNFAATSFRAVHPELSNGVRDTEGGEPAGG